MRPAGPHERGRRIAMVPEDMAHDKIGMVADR